MAEQAQISSTSGPLIRNISDTALWVAVYRARESERPDAIFRDPYARKLAGQRGEEIAAKSPRRSSPEWPFVARTVRFDEIVNDRIRQGADMVINLAAGLDTRPYRMELPASLQWVEVDLPAMIDYKEGILGAEKPRCRLERVRLDLANIEERRKLFARLSDTAKNALVLTEGLLTYLTRDEVTALGRDLAAQSSFRDWATDLCSPGLLKMLQKDLTQLTEAGLAPKFGPEEGPDFFLESGWKAIEVHSMLKTAAKIKRLPFIFRLFALFPDSDGRRQGSRIWGGVCGLKRM
jgi:methyltransferase (TIGR00027 family)